jgi:hypothetical protein
MPVCKRNINCILFILDVVKVQVSVSMYSKNKLFLALQESYPSPPTLCTYILAKTRFLMFLLELSVSNLPSHGNDVTVNEPITLLLEVGGRGGVLES